MHHSRSLGSLALSCVDSDREHLLPPNRPRKRSSLDTFLIPGRTRIPSHKSELFDVELTRNLLQSSMNQARDPPPYSEGPNRVPENHSHFHSLHRAANTSPVNAVCAIKTQPIDAHSQHDVPAVLFVPPRRNHHIELASNNPYRRHTSASTPDATQTFDGVQDLEREARITSTTWSTISKVSRRIFSDASDASRAYNTAKYNDAFNELAKLYGLQQLTFSAQDTMNEKTSNKSMDQPRRPGWFARKFLPRPSATYTYKSRTTYRPIPRKKSFSSRSSSFSDDGRRNILEGKTLEETCKLGGLGVLMLPPGYCLETPTLPTCLSATASYLLHHGVNAAGLFRISGQASIVNALYDYYSHQFGHAGSPTKVQTTVQPGQLPLHIEYTLPDIATFFKKVLKGLSGGLLGSMEIFEAVSQSLLKIEPVTSMNASEMKVLRAKLVALSLLSISSLHRFNLIQAVLGLFAYLADKAEETHALCKQDPEDHHRDGSPSGLMGHQAMGVCLGPLLIGDLMDDVSNVRNSQEKFSKEASQVKGKSKKKDSHKLENSTDLNALVERAHLSANVMQQLLVSWRDVVQQLRSLTASETALRNSALQKPPRMPHFAAATNAIRVTDEELLFLKMMRSGEIPLEYPFDVVIKRKVTAKGKSSMPQLIRASSPEQHTQREWFHPSHAGVEAEAKTHNQEDSHMKPVLAIKAASEAPVPDDDAGSLAANIMERGTSYRNSIASLDDMIAGQILPPREGAQPSSKPPLTGHRSPSDPYYTPTRGPSRHRSSSIDAFGTRDQLCLMIDEAKTPDDVTKPSENPMPPRRGLPPPPIETPPLPDTETRSRTASVHSTVASGAVNSSIQNAIATRNRKASKAASANAVALDQAMKVSGSGSSLHGANLDFQGRSYRSSRSNSGAGLEAKVSAPRFELPTIPPFENSEPSTREGPFVQEPSPNTPKKRKSLIPKPSGSGSPTVDVPEKSPPSFKRKSVFNIVKKDGPGPGKIAIPIVAKNTQSGSIHGKTLSQRSRRGLDALQPLSAQSLNSLSLRDLQALDPLSPQLSKKIHSPNALLSLQDSQNEQPETAIRDTSESQNITHSTLFAEVARLKRQMDHKDDLLQATRRSLEAATMAKEQGPSPPSGGNTTPKKGSWNKGTLSHEVKSMKSQRDSWRLRAEMAEKRLNGIEETGAWGEKKGGRKEEA